MCKYPPPHHRLGGLDPKPETLNPDARFGGIVKGEYQGLLRSYKMLYTVSPYQPGVCVCVCVCVCMCVCVLYVTYTHTHTPGALYMNPSELPEPLSPIAPPAPPEKGAAKGA
jgi:hypothetical protein